MWMKLIAAALSVLTIVFGTLKLSGSVAWPWWLVLAPLYPIAAWGAFIGFAALFMMWVFKDRM